LVFGCLLSDLQPRTNQFFPNYQLPITNYQLPITNYQLPITKPMLNRPLSFSDSNTLTTRQSRTTITKPEPFLTIENVSKVYPTKKGSFTVLDGVNLTVNEGEFICVIGHSGCGKSTLLNMVSGFAFPTSGEVRLQGKQITKPGL
jgi:bicarbonate transport system ATP-binding protein